MWSAVLETMDLARIYSETSINECEKAPQISNEIQEGDFSRSLLCFDWLTARALQIINVPVTRYIACAHYNKVCAKAAEARYHSYKKSL